jgi:hypothetical protein
MNAAVTSLRAAAETRRTAVEPPMLIVVGLKSFYLPLERKYY